VGKLEIKIKTITPLWTGGVDTTMDRIHETGLLGSLRWWYEAIVRGLGGGACDPVGDNKCRCDAKDSRPPEAQLCHACYAFGTTGWRRRFRLEVEDKTRPIWKPADRMLNIRPPGRTRGWYLPPGQMGTLTLKFAGDPNLLSLMAALLLFLEKWGALGTKSQLGYGVFTIENQDEVLEWARGKGENGPGWKWEILGKRPLNGKLPDLRRLGFFRYRFAPAQPGWWTHVPGLNRVATQVQPLVSRHQTAPVSPALKNEWRFNRWNRQWGNDREIFGSLRPNRMRSKVAVSWAYKVSDEWEVRGWVWLKSEKWADKVWSLLSEAEIWQSVLKVAGQMVSRKLTSAQDVQIILEERHD